MKYPIIKSIIIIVESLKEQSSHDHNAMPCMHNLKHPGLLKKLWQCQCYYITCKAYSNICNTSQTTIMITLLNIAKLFYI